MKSQFLVFVTLLVILSCYNAFGAIGGYDYCGKPCTDSNSIVCAYNQRCYTYFNNRCQMKKRNCDFNDRFLEMDISRCLLGSKCRGI